MLMRWIPGFLLCALLASNAGAEVLRFTGSFHTLYDCPDTWPGSACGSPPPQTVDIPISFAVEITQAKQYVIRTTSSDWHAPEFPLPPPITQATFESLAGRQADRYTAVNTYENGPVFRNLLLYAGRGAIWSGTDANGNAHYYSESVDIGFEGSEQRAAPGSPITFEELAALWNSYRTTGRDVRIHGHVAWSITKPDGSVQAAGHSIDGTVRLCLAPGAAGVALAAVARWVRP